MYYYDVVYQIIKLNPLTLLKTQIYNSLKLLNYLVDHKSKYF